MILNGNKRTHLYFIAMKWLEEHFLSLYRKIAHHCEKRKSLEGCDNNIEYIAHRLGWNEDDIKRALNKYKILQRYSSSKVRLI